jgi:hypothetical protein
MEHLPCTPSAAEVAIVLLLLLQFLQLHRHTPFRLLQALLLLLRVVRWLLLTAAAASPVLQQASGPQ